MASDSTIQFHWRCRPRACPGRADRAGAAFPQGDHAAWPLRSPQGDLDQIAGALEPLGSLQELDLSTNPGIGGRMSMAAGEGICKLAGVWLRAAPAAALWGRAATTSAELLGGCVLPAPAALWQLTPGPGYHNLHYCVV